MRETNGIEAKSIKIPPVVIRYFGPKRSYKRPTMAAESALAIAPGRRIIPETVELTCETFCAKIGTICSVPSKIMKAKIPTSVILRNAGLATILTFSIGSLSLSWRLMNSVKMTSPTTSMTNPRVMFVWKNVRLASVKAAPIKDKKTERTSILSSRGSLKFGNVAKPISKTSSISGSTRMNM